MAYVVDPFALLVALHHGQFLGHVQSERIFLDGAPLTLLPDIGEKVRHIVHLRKEAVLIDPILDPVREVLADFQKGMKVAAVDGLDGAVSGARFSHGNGLRRKRLASPAPLLQSALCRDPRAAPRHARARAP